MSDQPTAPTTPTPDKRKKKATALYEPSRIVDAHEAARILHSDYYSARRWAIAGELPLVRFPSTESLKGRKRSSPRPIRRLLFDVRDVEAFIERCKAV